MPAKVKRSYQASKTQRLGLGGFNPRFVIDECKRIVARINRNLLSH